MKVCVSQYVSSLDVGIRASAPQRQCAGLQAQHDNPAGVPTEQSQTAQRRCVVTHTSLQQQWYLLQVVNKVHSLVMLHPRKQPCATKSAHYRKLNRLKIGID